MDYSEALISIRKHTELASHACREQRWLDARISVQEIRAASATLAADCLVKYVDRVGLPYGLRFVMTPEEQDKYGVFPMASSNA